MTRRFLLAALLLLLPLSACEATKPLPTPDSARASAGDRHWQPRPGLRWQIQLTGTFVDAPANVYDLDPFVTAAETVANLRAQGRQTICHLDVGAADMALPDAHRLPSRTLGTDAGQGRRWLDIRDWATLAPVLADRLELCRAKGFDAVDADATSAYQEDTGFGITITDQLRFNQRVADLAHRLGLKIGVRAEPSLARQVEPFTDFGITLDCFASAGCDGFFAFIRADKAVFDVETAPIADMCPLARAYGYAVTRSPTEMNGFTQPCS